MIRRGVNGPSRATSDQMTTRISKITLIALLVLVATSMDARAGLYHVYSCRTPSGQSAPVDGWSGTIAKGSAYDDYTKNTCPGAGALIAALGEQTGHLSGVDLATWLFSVPASEALAGATLGRAGNLHGGPNENSTYQFWL